MQDLAGQGSSFTRFHVVEVTVLEPGAMQCGKVGKCDPLATLKADQIQLLEDNFARMRQPDASSLMLISAECGLTEEAAALWFKQRNAKWRQLEGFPPESSSVKD
ncbi:homeodomain-only protein [Rhinoraja longicauda]